MTDDNGVYLYPHELGETTPTGPGEGDDDHDASVQRVVERANAKSAARADKQARQAASRNKALADDLDHATSSKRADYDRADQVNAAAQSDDLESNIQGVPGEIVDEISALADDDEPDIIDGEQDDDESESEDDDSDSEDSDDDDDADDDDTGADDEPELHKVKIDGKTEQVSLEELKKGYSRESSFTRKTQVLAAERRQMEQERAGVQQVAAAHDEALQGLSDYVEALSGALPPEARQAAAQAVQELSQRREALRQAEHGQMQQQYAQAQQAQSEQFAQENREWLDSQNERLLELVPEWADSDARTAGLSEVWQYAKSVGFDNYSIETAIGRSATAMDTVRRAMLYDRQQGRLKSMPKPKVRQSSAPVLKPGTTSPDSGRRMRRRSFNDNMDRLAKSGDVRDAAAVFLDLGTVDD